MAASSAAATSASCSAAEASAACCLAVVAACLGKLLYSTAICLSVCEQQEQQPTQQHQQPRFLFSSRSIGSILLGSVSVAALLASSSAARPLLVCLRALSITIIEQFNVCFSILVFYPQIIKNQPSDQKPRLVCHPTNGAMGMF